MKEGGSSEELTGSYPIYKENLTDIVNDTLRFTKLESRGVK